jgi:hypothetical protein
MIVKADRNYSERLKLGLNEIKKIGRGEIIKILCQTLIGSVMKVI